LGRKKERIELSLQNYLLERGNGKKQTGVKLPPSEEKNKSEKLWEGLGMILKLM